MSSTSSCSSSLSRSKSCSCSAPSQDAERPQNSSKIAALARISRFERSPHALLTISFLRSNIEGDAFYSYRFAHSPSLRPDFPRSSPSSSRFLLSFLFFSSLFRRHSTLRYSPATLSSRPMSSSTIPQTPVNSGECVVCGRTTTTRCSSCASQGLDWMFFCSREHQKLVSFFALVTIDQAHL